MCLRPTTQEKQCLCAHSIAHLLLSGVLCNGLFCMQLEPHVGCSLLVVGLWPAHNKLTSATNGIRKVQAGSLGGGRCSMHALRWGAHSIRGMVRHPNDVLPMQLYVACCTLLSRLWAKEHDCE